MTRTIALMMLALIACGGEIAAASPSHDAGCRLVPTSRQALFDYDIVCDDAGPDGAPR